MGGKGENMRDVIRTIKYKMSMKKKKRPVLGYLPINTGATSLDNSINTNNSLNTTKSSTDIKRLIIIYSSKSLSKCRIIHYPQLNIGQNDRVRETENSRVK